MNVQQPASDSRRPEGSALGGSPSAAIGRTSESAGTGLPVDGVPDRDDLPRGRLAELDLALARCAQQSGALIWTGEPGTGKSELLRHIVGHIKHTDAAVVTVPVIHDEDGSGTALDALVRQLLAWPSALGSSPRAVTAIVPASLRGPGAGADISRVGRALADLVAAVARDRTVVFIADDLDLVDAVTRSAVVGAVIERRAPVVLLATATDPGLARRLPYEVERRPLASIDALDALALLRKSLRVPVAPHVAQLLTTAVAGAPTAVLETARMLTSAQLAGQSLIPDPLPVAPAVRRAVARSLDDASPADRALLLAAAVSVVDRTDLLLGAVGSDIDTLVASEAIQHLDLVAGHAHLTDPRVRAVVHEDASMGQRTAIHQRLATAHAAAGFTRTATWHTALAALRGDPALAERLMAIAEDLLAQGQAVWAQRVAREALSHATGTLRATAAGLAGRAALHAGHVSDAVELLREAIRSTPPGADHSLRAALLVAVTLSTGQVPEDFGAADSVQAQLVGVLLHIERGDSGAARALLEASRQRVQEPLDARGIALADLWLCGVDDHVDGDSPSVPQTEPDALRMTASRVIRALVLGLDGHTDEARGVLTATVSELAPLAAGLAWDSCQAHGTASRRSAFTPLVEAYLCLAEVLIESWAGNVAAASASFERAALRLPMALPAAGFGVVLAGRLGVLRTGMPGKIAEALEDLVPLQQPVTVRVGLLVSRGLTLLLRGEDRSATTLLELAGEASNRPVLPLPLPSLAPEQVRILLGCSQGSLRSDGSEDVRSTVEWASRPGPGTSPLDGAHARLVAGKVCCLDGRVADGVEHLHAAAELFRECGAPAMADFARRLAAQASDPAEASTVRGPGSPTRTTGATGGTVAGSDADAVWACRLTEREREVARIVAGGASNRAVASTLFVSIRTVEVHLTSIFRKLQISSRVELAILVSRADSR